MDVKLAFTTVAAVPDAERIAQTLVEEKLAACVNIIPGVRSVYRWQGRIEDEGELLLIMKTTASLAARLEKRLMELHPYETPELVVLGTEQVSAAYAAWLTGSVGEAAQS